jgi:uncharacterized membrane protein
MEKGLTVVLAIAILGAVGTLIYTMAVPKPGEKFTEFYILGIKCKPADYPTVCTLDNGSVVVVEYGDGRSVPAQQGNVTIGISNQEYETSTYLVMSKANGEPLLINWEGSRVVEIGPMTLAHGETRELPVGLMPSHTGDAQLVELILYKDGGAEPYRSLRIWINVR